LCELLEEQPGLTSTEARRRLHCSHETAKQAINLGILEGKIHQALAGPTGWPALFPGPHPRPDRAESRAEFLAPIAAQLVVAAGREGVGRKRLHAEMHVAHDLGEEAIEIAIQAREIHEDWISLKDRLGRPRRRLRLVAYGAGP
jgi:hypothetical protein